MARDSGPSNLTVALAILVAIIVWRATSSEPWQSWSRDNFWKTDRPLADPGALLAGDELHVYTTSARQCVPGKCPTYWVPHFTSSALDEPGNVAGDAMPDLPAWVAPNERNIWAPSVVSIGGRYVLYFSATSARPGSSGSKCLGLAIADAPAGPFAPQPDPLHCATGGFWSVDPYAVSDGETWFLLWRQDDAANWTGKIVGAPLTADGMALATPDPQTLVTGRFAWEEGQRDKPGIGPVESPAMARHPDSGEWLLTWSGNRWQTEHYATGLARCQGPLGPCERISRDEPWLRTSDDTSVRTEADFVGAGGLSFVMGSDDELYAVFHAYRGTQGPSDSRRVGWAYRVEPDADSYVLTEF